MRSYPSVVASALPRLSLLDDQPLPRLAPGSIVLPIREACLHLIGLALTVRS